MKTKCPDCDGMGKICCHECGGDTTVECPCCESEMTCPNCEGSGREVCDECDGAGFVEDDQ